MVTNTNADPAATTGGIKARRCGLTKQDFLPEESFKSWGNYVNALSNTKKRLKNRFLSRSSDNMELENVRARSHHDMKKDLNWLDILWFGIGSVMGAGLFVLTGEAAHNDAGPAVVISYLISGVSALLSVLCYIEFSIELPVAGGSFAYLRVELGDFVAYIAAGNILFEYIVGGASVARAWTSYFATLCNHNPNDFRINIASSTLGEDYRHLDLIAVGISIIICVVACTSIRGSSRFNTIATIIHLVVMVFILIAGLTKANPKNVTNFAPFGVRGIMTASAKLFFAYVGFDAVATLGEEVKNTRRDIPIGLIGSTIIIIVSYCLLSATLILMLPYDQIDVDAPFTLAFEAVGLKWAKYIVAFGALKGMTSSILANIIAQARYFTHIGRTHMAPPFLAAINEKTGTPVNATIVMTVANCIVAFFTGLDVLANLLSITTLFIFTLVAIALLVRRYYVTGETSEWNRNKFIVFMVLIVGSSVGLAVFWARNSKGWVGYAVTVPIWFMATLLLQLTVGQARKPKKWAVPLLPWLPCASIGINIFIMGSFDRASYVRFGVWTLMLLVYYFFVALHASYDAAKETERDVNVAQIETGLTEYTNIT